MARSTLASLSYRVREAGEELILEMYILAWYNQIREMAMLHLKTGPVLFPRDCRQLPGVCKCPVLSCSLAHFLRDRVAEEL